jgi:hypothetical protein
MLSVGPITPTGVISRESSMQPRRIVGIKTSAHAGISNPPLARWTQARHNRILGSERFVDRLRTLIQGRARHDLHRDERDLPWVELDRVVQTVCRHYGVGRSELARRGSRSPTRAALAFLAREYTEATLADLMPVLDVSSPESVPNLTKRFSIWLVS